MAVLIFLLLAFFIVTRPAGSAAALWADRLFSGIVLTLATLALIAILRK
ncbi:MAG: hypothetical protein ACM3JB_14785 [Acidobacteriaceae bacterium]